MRFIVVVALALWPVGALAQITDIDALRAALDARAQTYADDGHLIRQDNRYQTHSDALATLGEADRQAGLTGLHALLEAWKMNAVKTGALPGDLRVLAGIRKSNACARGAVAEDLGWDELALLNRKECALMALYLEGAVSGQVMLFQRNVLLARMRELMDGVSDEAVKSALERHQDPLYWIFEWIYKTGMADAAPAT